MKRCIYCGKNEKEVTFDRKEHVLPRLMGSFSDNLTIIDYVCDDCNSKVFSPLETKFKEDTEEGIFYQMFNLKNSFQIRIRGDNIKTSFSPGLGDDFFNEIFPFFKQEEGEWKIFILPQIKIKRYGNNGYLILLVDELKKLTRDKKKFLDIKELLRNVQSKDVSIFTGSDGEHDDKPLKEAIQLVSDLGVDYKEGKRKFALTASRSKNGFGISMSCNIGNEASRVIAKIAFNYFSYCAIEDKRGSILFHKNFSKIRSYILGKIDLPVEEIIVEIKNEPIIYDEKMVGARWLGHTITFSLDDKNNIISEISFFGKRIYTVMLGPAPQELIKREFGCGHFFDPIGNKIFGLTQNFTKHKSGDKAEPGLFNRI